ncbi:MAG: HD-GYP domain-containing protein [Lachnospiraceae bacterium]|nr:HD-GYP domain-containing protein [Lachnospiraceae bacterium]
MGKKRVRINDLTGGMIVADDVYTSTDQLIITKKSIINDKLISKLKVYGVPAINVIEVENNKTADEDAAIMTQTEKIKSTEEFKDFRNTFSVVTSDLQKYLTHAVANGMAQEDLDGVRAVTRGIMEVSMKMPHIFDMLHCMRDSSDGVYTHSVNVAVISAVLAKWLRFSAQDQEQLALAGMLHDIGKLTIPENILLKPYKLTEKEYAIVKSHAFKGYNQIKDAPLDNHIKYGVLMHHERCDGSGYPTGVKGDKIDRYAKVLAIADVYDAMTSSRVYRDSICPFDVIHNFEKDGLQLYEIEYIMTFLKNIANTYIHSQVRLSNGVIGEIIMINNNKLARPVVKAGETFIDLSKESELKIDEIL